jgi:hypothetical protein
MTSEEILSKHGFPLPIVVLDFETFFDKTCSIQKQQMVEYVTDPKFKVLAMATHIDGAVRGVLQSAVQDRVNDLRRLYGKNLEKCTLVCHNAHFDCSILVHAFGLLPRYVLDTRFIDMHIEPDADHDLASICKRWSIPYVKGDMKRFKALDYAFEFLWDELRQDNENDVQSTRMVLDSLLPRITWPEQELFVISHTVQLGLQARLLLDVPRAKDIAKSLQLELAKLISETGFSLKDINSDYFETIFLDALGDEAPAYREGKSGDILAVSKKDPEALQYFSHPNPRVQQLVRARSAAKSYPLHIRRILRFVGMARALSSGLVVPLHYYGAHCLPGEAEVLTRTGWQPLRDWGGGEIVQWEEDEDLHFFPAQNNSFSIQEEVLDIVSPHCKTTVTQGHTIPGWFSRSKIFRTHPAARSAEHSIIQIPVGGILQGHGTITTEQMMVLIAVQADGHWQLDTRSGRELRFGLTKKRKQQRMRLILAATRIPFREARYPSHGSEITFRIRFEDCPVWLTPERKQFGPWLLDMTVAARQLFAKELQYWDGNDSHNQIEYYSTDPVNHEWVQTISHLSGHLARTTWKAAKKNRVPCGTTHIRIGVRCSTKTGILKRHWHRRQYAGKVFCPTTQTGFWLCRHNGTVFVTGNTGRFSGADGINYQNLTKRSTAPRAAELRECITTPTGYSLLVADQAQGEARIAAWLGGETALLEDFALGRDPYSRLASKIAGKEIHKPTKEEYKENPQEAKVLTNWRQLGKAVVLGAGFGMGADRLQAQLGNEPDIDKELLTDENCHKLIATFRSSFPGIVKCWYDLQDACFQAIRCPGAMIAWNRFKLWVTPWFGGTRLTIRLPSGRCLFYDTPEMRGQKRLELYLDGKKCWGGKIWENLVQAISRDLLVCKLPRLEANDLPVVYHVHDSVACLVLDENVYQAKDMMHDVLCGAELWSEGLPFDWEINVTKSFD